MEIECNTEFGRCWTQVEGVTLSGQCVLLTLPSSVYCVSIGVNRKVYHSQMWYTFIESNSVHEMQDNK